MNEWGHKHCEGSDNEKLILNCDPFCLHCAYRMLGDIMKVKLFTAHPDPPPNGSFVSSIFEYCDPALLGQRSGPME